MRVPYNVQIAPDNLLPKVASLLDNEVGNVAKLAIVILIEQKRGQESEWAPYISCLPWPREMHSTVCTITFCIFSLLGSSVLEGHESNKNI